ncbi:hypothetical protein EDD16DRAFT_1525689 [Pisolithus croceorrhizus]|nr:hypothetical protein EDD16DRAFT_1525689 [Pisolithus croceorrhizus]KAI6168649.1 hypothetical protein EDD17DRAFT_1503450 [Pisolithus thermaeus]
MSQPSLLMPIPPATAVRDWLAVPDSAIQSDSDDDEAVAKAKYDERQRRKKARKDQKAAEEAAAQERAEAERREREAAKLCRQEEAERREREENERREKEETERREREENERQEREANECREREAQARVASQTEGGGSQSRDPEVSSPTPAESNPVPAEGSQSQGGSQADHVTCARCARAEVDCTYELAKATGTKKVRKCVVPAESTSPRAGEKKKRARAKSPEVEVVGGSSQAEKGKSVARDTSITSGLYAIAAAIDRHTEEMAQLQQTVKTLGNSHHHVIESMAELLQETTYAEPELPAESGMKMVIRKSRDTGPSFQSEGEYREKSETKAERQNDTGNVAKYKVPVLRRDKPEVNVCTGSDQTESKNEGFYSQGHEEDLDCREWGIPEGSREYLEGGRTLVFNLPKKGNAPKTSLGDQHLISRRGWRSSGGWRNRSRGKKVKNEWECHVARECKGLELSTGEGRLDTAKASRWEMEELVVIRVHAVPGNPNEGAINIAGVMLPDSGEDMGNRVKECDSDFWSVELKFRRRPVQVESDNTVKNIFLQSRIKPGFVTPACPELDYCAGARPGSGRDTGHSGF